MTTEIKTPPFFVESNNTFNLKTCEDYGIDKWVGANGKTYYPKEVAPSHLCNFLNKLHREGRLFSHRPTVLPDNDWADYDAFDPFMTETSAEEYFGDCH